MMKSLIVSSTDQGTWDIHIIKKEIPKPSKNECLVRVKAAALNRRDYWISVGKYPGIKSGVTLGSDACGVVVEGDDKWVGKEVWINPNQNWGENPEFQSGQYTILGTPKDGTLAEYLSVPTDRLKEKPAHLTSVEAAAFPLAALTAYRAVFTKGQVKSGDKVLVTGIGGGVAQFAMAFAKNLGARVSVSSSSDWKLEKAKNSGADFGFNYKHENWLVKASAEAGKFDVIIDSAGGNALNSYLKIIKSGGKIVMYGSTTGKPEHLDAFRLFWSQASILGSTMGNDDEFQRMTEFVARQQIKPTLDKVYKPDQMVEAVKSMKSSDNYGKKVIQFLD